MPGSVWNYLWGHALKRFPWINRKSRVSYPGPEFLSSATWPSLPKKHYNGLNQTKPNQKLFLVNILKVNAFSRPLLERNCMHGSILIENMSFSRNCDIKTTNVKRVMDASIWVMFISKISNTPEIEHDLQSLLLYHSLLWISFQSTDLADKPHS